MVAGELNMGCETDILFENPGHVGSRSPRQSDTNPSQVMDMQIASLDCRLCDGRLQLTVIDAFSYLRYRMPDAHGVG